MRICPKCQAKYPDDARFCPEDGTPLQVAGDPLIGQVLLGQFEIREVCGKGSMGTVYRAWQASMQRDVAVKVLRKDLLRDERVVKRFHREALAAARLAHPNIITVYLVDDTKDGVPFMVMEYITGQSLTEACEAAGPMPAPRAINIGTQIAAALAEAHGQQIIHRDLKPDNILLSSRRTQPDFVKVLDFGIAKILYGNAEPLTQTGAIFGTPHYLAPEQASGGDIDHRCDLYALGVILYRMVSGRLPFDSTSGMEVLLQHLREQPPRPREIVPTVPLALEQVILRCLAKSPDERYASCDDLAQALQSVSLEPPAADQPAAPRAEPAADAGDAIPALDPDDPDADPRFQVPADDELSNLAPEASPTEPALPVGSTTVGLVRNISGRRRYLAHGLITLLAIGAGGAAGALLHRVNHPGAVQDGPAAPARMDAAMLAPQTPDAAGAAAAADTAAAPAPRKKRAARRRPSRAAARSGRSGTRPKPQAKPKARPKARPGSAGVTPPPAPAPRPAAVRPLGPAPETDHGEVPPAAGTDDGSHRPDTPPPRPPVRRKPDAQPRRPERGNDNFYDLVD